MTAITEATLLKDLEFNTRTLNAMLGQGLETLGDLKRVGSEHMRQYAKGVGSRGKREMDEMLLYLEPPTLLNTPEQIAYRMENNLCTAQALMHDVARIMQRAALKGHISGESRNDAARKLVEAARYIEKLPAPGDEA